MVAQDEFTQAARAAVDDTLELPLAHAEHIIIFR
jgi:hypothetical protein